MSSSLTPKLTDFGPRLCANDQTVRANAQAELESLGDAAKDILLKELDARATLPENTGPLFALLIFLPGLVNMVVGTFPNAALKDQIGQITFVLWVPLLALIIAVSARHYQQTLRQQRILALTLARYDDLRVLAGLSQAALLLPGAASDQEDEKVLVELNRLFALHFAGPNPPPFSWNFQKQLHTEINRLYPKRRLSWARLFARDDFSEAQANVIAFIAQILAQSSNSEDRALLERMALTPATLPNRRFVQEIAQVLITPTPETPGKPDVAPSLLQSLTPLSPPSAGIPLTLKRQ